MSHRSTSLPGPGDQCLCGSYYACRCRPDPDPDALYDEAYDRGYDACLEGGYDNHPLACWPSDAAEAALARDWRRLATGGSVVGTDGRRFYGSNWFNVPGAWRHWGPYGHSPLRGEPCPEGYLQGFDDAGAGLPSAVADPERHAACAAALDAYEEPPDLYDEALGPGPAPSEVESSLPF